MAAIDKIYVSSYQQCKEFKEWLSKQRLKDKYGKEISLLSYFFDWWDNPEEWEDVCTHPVFSAPYYVDAYIIRNCPLDYIQEELMLNYGYWSQKRIKEYYEDVKNWNSENGECPYWAKLEDFITLEDGTMIIHGLEKSDYEKIKDNELYSSPKIEDYEYGKHFRCIKHPFRKFNTPFRCKSYMISLSNISMWYHNSTNSWDFTEEFVDSDWTSSVAYVKTIKALRRLMLKWKLPVGTKVTATGKYIFDTYEFIIMK